MSLAALFATVLVERSLKIPICQRLLGTVLRTAETTVDYYIQCEAVACSMSLPSYLIMKMELNTTRVPIRLFSITNASVSILLQHNGPEAGPQHRRSQNRRSRNDFTRITKQSDYAKTLPIS